MFLRAVGVLFFPWCLDGRAGGGKGVGVQCHGYDLDLAVGTLSLKILSALYLKNRKV